MSFYAHAKKVGFVQVSLANGKWVPGFRTIQNMGAAPVFLGPTGVTVNTGWRLCPGEEIQWNNLNTAPADEALYAIAERGPVSGELRILDAKTP
jgi:hypothetical protein